MSRMPSYVKGKGFIAGMWLVLWLLEFGGIYVYVLWVRDGSYGSGRLLGPLLILPVGTFVYRFRRRGLKADRKAFEQKYPDLDLHEDFTPNGDSY